MRRDLLWSAAVALAVGAIALAFDATEAWFELTREVEFLEVDELLVAALAGLLCFAFARLRAHRREIGEREAVERRLQESEAQLRSILDHSPVEIYVKDLEGRHVMVNRREEQLFGQADGGIVGKTAFDLFPEDCAIVHEAHDRDVLHTGAALEREYEIPMADGVHTFLAVKFPIRDPGGRIGRIGAVVTDITERKHNERELEEAKVEAERASAAKSRFLAAASHDLRQPLQAMGLLTGSLSETALDARQQGLVEAVGEAIGSMGSMLNALLDISELDAGAITPHPVDFDLAVFLKRVTRDFAVQARERGIDLRLVPCSVAVHGDAALLERIVANLLSNALRYTHEGRVLIGCRRRGERVAIQVWDTGIGLEDKNLPAIFEEYYQVGNVARDRRKGLGLGLALVDRLTKLMALQVTVRSELGKGSLFEIEVPRGRHEPREEPEGPIALEGHEAAASVLLIEDDHAVREAAARLMSNWGFEVVSAENGAEGLQAIAAQGLQPNIVVADFRLPDDEDGIGTIARIRERLALHVPGIIVTGDTSAEVASAIKAADCEVLHKPVAPAKLRALLRFHLDGDDQPFARAAAAGIARQA